MDDAVRDYIAAIDPEQRPLFDRVDGLILAVHPDARIELSYQMPTYVVGDRRLHVGVWKHGVSIYGVHPDRDAGFAGRHPDTQSGKGTTRLRTSDAGDFTDEELTDMFRAALAP
jgi:uncharacterized protein YdhG (YjbR/CyaY superfamily)